MIIKQPNRKRVAQGLPIKSTHETAEEEDNLQKPKATFAPEPNHLPHAPDKPKWCALVFLNIHLCAN